MAGPALRFVGQNVTDPLPKKPVTPPGVRTLRKNVMFFCNGFVTGWRLLTRRYSRLWAEIAFAGENTKTPAKCPFLLDFVRVLGWRREPELNRCTRFCRPLPNHSAIAP